MKYSMNLEAVADFIDITRPYFDAQYMDPVEAFIPEAEGRQVFRLYNIEGES